MSSQHPPTADDAAVAHVDAQRERFDAQAGGYAEHHSNQLVQAYRDRFIREKVLPERLDGARVLDAMCGSGEETGALRARGATVEGLDLSGEFAELYRSRWDAPCHVASITETGLPDDSFDVVYVCGGLHHIRPLLTEAIDEIHRILAPGGLFVFVEPNHDSWSDRLRRVWYRLDRRFSDDEAAISIDADLEPRFAGRFRREVVHQGGNLAYLLVAQSFIFRTPERFRQRSVGALFRAEEALHGTVLDPAFFVCGRYVVTDGGGS